jgi:hypothetical protein
VEVTTGGLAIFYSFSQTKQDVNVSKELSCRTALLLTCTGLLNERRTGLLDERLLDERLLDKRLLDKRYSYAKNARRLWHLWLKRGSIR